MGKLSKVILVVAGLIIPLFFFTVGGILFWRQYKIKLWPTVEGKVLDTYVSEYKRERSGSVSSAILYTGRVQYVYKVDEQELTNDVISLMSSSTNDRDSVVQQIKPYSVDDTVTVYYNPLDHGESCIVPEVSWFTLVPFFAGGAFLFAAYGLHFIITRF